MRLAPLALVALASCAPSLTLPPPAVPSGEWDEGLAQPVAVAEIPTGAALVRHDFDTLTGYTRRLVTTHKGVYTGWVQKPQLSFFALTRGTARPAAMPSVVALVFRTLEPDAVTGPRLVLWCGATVDTVPLATASHVAPTGNTHSHFLTYLLPTDRIASFANCNAGDLQVGQTRVHFDGLELGGLRALLFVLGATRLAAGT